MSSTTMRQRLTAAEYYAMPVGPPYSQLVRGELIMSPSPVIRHQRILGKLHIIIGKFLERHPLGDLILAPL